MSQQKSGDHEIDEDQLACVHTKRASIRGHVLNYDTQAAQSQRWATAPFESVMNSSVTMAVMTWMATAPSAAPLEYVRTQSESFVAFELEAIESTVDGCENCGCRTKAVLPAHQAAIWWVTYGILGASTQENWSARDSSSRCGTRPSDTSSDDFRRTVGTPYSLVELTTAPVIASDPNPSLRIKVVHKKLTGPFGQGRQPTYARSTDTRVLRLDGEVEITLPLLVANEQETEALGINEVWVRLRATPLWTRTAASYGAIAVTADQPGAEILLDGFPVGRIAEARPTVLKNVPVGEREIAARDFSRRETRTRVLVQRDQTAGVALAILPLSKGDALPALAPIGMNAQNHEEYWRPKDGAVVVKVPAGEFLMGSREGEGQADERPQRHVFLSEFLIDKTEVTWRQLRKFSEATDQPPPPAPVWGSQDDYSAANLTWDEARAYCEWVGGRLPTEAEWEKAARGSDGRMYPWGNEWDPARCNSISGGPHRPEPFGSFPECLSPYGILDTSGSVWEWCADWYGADYYVHGPSRDPNGPAAGTARVLRGGDWISQPLWVRAAYRFKVPPTSRNANHGFRCAQDVPR